MNLTTTLYDNRQIRVFISSTFRDMQEERDYLVKFIFPQLQKFCESRGVTWSEVDLRWGVTDEETAEGKVLPICLEEIKRCRPYFIGLLGERYGWVPDIIPPELIEREPWLKSHLNDSVTELEILFGVLNNPEMAEHALFYFRNPVFVNGVPPEKRKDFTLESAEATEKLKALKARIRTSGFPVKEKYSDAKALGEFVLKDMTDMINRLYPEGSQPDPLDREAMDHGTFARSRARIYIGRKEYFDRLDAHIEGDGLPLVVLGGAGSGKSALLANWAIKYQQKKPEDFVLVHFIGGTPDSANTISMMRRIMQEMKRRFPQEFSSDAPEQPEKIRGDFPQWLSKAATAHRIILILDGLNQIDDRETEPDLGWLPVVTPPNCRVIVSTRLGRIFDAVRCRRWPEMVVQPLTAPERKELIEKFLDQYGRRLSPAPLDRIASAEQNANPLFLRAMLDELRQFGEHERLGERIEYYLLARDPKELYDRILQRWEQDYERERAGLVGESMSLLWASRMGLTESEILDLLGTEQHTWAPLYLAAEDGLMNHNGRLAFSTSFLRDAVQHRYLSNEEQQVNAHMDLADYYGTLNLSRLYTIIFRIETLFTPQSWPQRQLVEFPWQLLQAKAWDRLSRLLVDNKFFKTLWKYNHFDILKYWSTIEKESSLRLVEVYRPILEAPKDYVDIIPELGTLFQYTGNIKEAKSLSEFVLNQVKDSQLETWRVTSFNLMLKAIELRATGDLDGAQKNLQEMLKITRQAGDLSCQALALGNLGAVLAEEGALDKAMTYLTEQEILVRKLGMKDGLQSCLGNQAIIQTKRGQWNKALALHQEEEQLCLEIGDQDALSICWLNQGELQNRLGNMEDAMRLYQKVESKCRALGQKDRLQRVLGAQADVLRERGQLEKAMERYQEKERLARELGDLKALSVCLEREGLIRKERGDLAGAMELLSEQERICRVLGDQSGLANSLINQANILRRRKDFEGALGLMKQAEAICRTTGNEEILVTCLVNQGAMLKYQLHNPTQASVVIEEAYRLANAKGLEHMALSVKEELEILRIDEKWPSYEVSQRIVCNNKECGSQMEYDCGHYDLSKIDIISSGESGMIFMLNAYLDYDNANAIKQLDMKLRNYVEYAKSKEYRDKYGLVPLVILVGAFQDPPEAVRQHAKKITQLTNIEIEFVNYNKS